MSDILSERICVNIKCRRNDTVEYHHGMYVCIACGTVYDMKYEVESTDLEPLSELGTMIGIQYRRGDDKYE